jgi:lysophospholipase L1-like esterase
VFEASHTYQTQGTFTITETGTVVSGNCTTTSGSVQFTMLAYAALGDSYSAGTGAGSYLMDSLANPARCYRSQNAYSEVVDATLGNTPKTPGGPFTFVACNGAVLANFETVQDLGNSAVAPQIDALMSISAVGWIGLVTFTIGGNDLHFKDVLTDCVLARVNRQSCKDKDGAKMVGYLQALKKRLPTYFRDIKTANGLAPGAKVLVAGYPEPFDPAWFLPNVKTPACGTGAGTNFETQDMKWLNATAANLDDALKAAAKVAHFTYVPDLTAYSGHYLCENPSDLNSVVLSNTAFSFHPNVTGQQAIAAAVAKALGIG